jgi:hypothetical protein
VKPRHAAAPWKVAVGAVALLFVGSVYLSVRRSDAFGAVRDCVFASAEVNQAIGKIRSVVLFPTFRVRFSGTGRGYGSLTVLVHGSQRRALANVEVWERDGVWRVGSIGLLTWDGLHEIDSCDGNPRLKPN